MWLLESQILMIINVACVILCWPKSSFHWGFSVRCNGMNLLGNPVFLLNSTALERKQVLGNQNLPGD